MPLDIDSPDPGLTETDPEVFSETEHSAHYSGSSLLSAMKKAGRALVKSVRRKTVMLTAIAAAGAALSAPSAFACPDGCVCSSYTYCGAATTLGQALGKLYSSLTGDPINVATGNMFLEVTDYKTAGQNPLEFMRFYNSQGNAGNIVTYATSLGPGWRTNYDRYLQFSPSVSPTTVIYETADGAQITFTQSGTSWVTSSNIDLSLNLSGGVWTLTDHNDTTETYADQGNGYAILSSVTARNGYSQSLSYTFNSGTYRNQLTQVTDSYGRSLNLTYTGISGNMLNTLSTPDTPVMTYGYVSTTGGTILSTVSYNTSPVTSQTYNYGNATYSTLLTSVTDENSNTLASWTYNTTPGTSTSGWALTSQAGGSLAANLTTLTYNSGGTTTVTNPFSVADTYSFTTILGVPVVNGISRAATSTTAAATESFGYDSNGYMNSFTDWKGNQTTTVNNAQGNPTTINEAVGSSVARTTTVSYDPTWIRLPHQVVTTGLTTGFTYDGNGNPLTRTDTDTTTNTVPYSTNGQTRTTTFTWNSTGELTSVQLPRTDATVKTIFGYDSSGTLTSITDPLSHVTNITAHTPGGYPTTIVDPNGVTTTLGWDARLNLNTVTLATTAGSLVTTYTHDPANNLTAIQWPDNSKLTYGYDAAHRLNKITDLNSNTVNYTLDALGDPTLTQVKNASGTVTWKDTGTFDALGRLTKDTNGVTQSTSLTYDTDSNILTVVPPSPAGTTTFTYDALNRPATRVDPSPGGTTTLTFDAHDRATNVQDAKGNSTVYTRDGFGDATQLASPDSGTSVLTYDKDSNPTQKVFAGGQTVNLTFDAKDRNLTVAYPSDSTLNISKTYDQTTGHGFGIGRLTSVTDQVGSDSLTYDERANITNESRVVTGAGTLTTGTAFDNASRVASITYPSGTVVDYTRNNMGQPTGITVKPAGASSFSNVATSITHEPFGPETGLTFGNGITGTYGYDAAYRSTTRTDANGSTNILKHTYAYYNNDSLHTLTDAVTAANTQTLGYDTLDRLTSATSGTGGYGTYSWTWDKVSSVTKQTINGTATTFNIATGSNRLTSLVSGSTTTTVDTTANGNIQDTKVGSTTVTSYTYNQANQMASALGSLGSSASYQYGFDGQRLEKASSGTYPILYQYSRAANELLAENDLHSGQTADYIYMDPGRNSRPIAEVNPTGGAIYFTHTDRLGTPQTVTNSSKTVVWSATYNPFGDAHSFSGTLTTQSLRLPGQQFDPESANNHNGFRDYAGTLTRYIQSDPIGLTGGMNTYQYVEGNPFKFTDRLGLSPAQKLAKIPGQGAASTTTIPIACDSSDNPACSGGGRPNIQIGGNCNPNDPNCVSGSGQNADNGQNGNGGWQSCMDAVNATPGGQVVNFFSMASPLLGPSDAASRILNTAGNAGSFFAGHEGPWIAEQLFKRGSTVKFIIDEGFLPVSTVSTAVQGYAALQCLGR